MNKIKEWYNNLIFEYQMKKAVKKVESLDRSLLKSGILISLAFQKEWYKGKFDNGMTVEKAVIEKAKDIGVGIIELIEKNEPIP